jgi:hypothetical protein
MYKATSAFDQREQTETADGTGIAVNNVYNAGSSGVGASSLL